VTRPFYYMGRLCDFTLGKMGAKRCRDRSGRIYASLALKINGHPPGNCEAPLVGSVAFGVFLLRAVVECGRLAAGRLE
jgi:hypothetical protein